jgi:hypothetical protein
MAARGVACTLLEPACRISWPKRCGLPYMWCKACRTVMLSPMLSVLKEAPHQPTRC